jgi:hypothetical protein
MSQQVNDGTTLGLLHDNNRHILRSLRSSVFQRC